MSRRGPVRRAAQLGGGRAAATVLLRGRKMTRKGPPELAGRGWARAPPAPAGKPAGEDPGTSGPEEGAGRGGEDEGDEQVVEAADRRPRPQARVPAHGEGERPPAGEGTVRERVCCACLCAWTGGGRSFPCSLRRYFAACIPIISHHDGCHPSLRLRRNPFQKTARASENPRNEAQV